MMFEEVVILAGGFGTRLSHVLGNVPKPMAPVHGKPFLTYLLRRLEAAGAKNIILATGYRHEVIERYFGSRYRSLQISYSQEDKPLFTGGAILQASRLVRGEDFLVLNGDTLFDIDFEALCAFHTRCGAAVSLALREVDDTARYGAVQTDGGHVVKAFREKDASAGKGLINGGIYAIHREWLQGLDMPEKFSFEKEVLQAMVVGKAFYGLAFRDYFIDIGIPEDYHRAQQEFASLFPDDKFLFLDRDGVLNRRIVGDYVRNWNQWEWLPNAREAVARLSRHYTRTFIVSNQQGIGKGFFSMEDAYNIHRHVLEEITASGGHIDHVYICPDLKDSGSNNRKPAIGMALQACTDYPDVQLTDSVVIGDSVSDMQFGWQAGMRCIYLSNGEPIPAEVQDYTDWVCPNLAAIH